MSDDIMRYGKDVCDEDTMPTKIVAHKQTNSWYSIFNGENWDILIVAPMTIKSTNLGLPLDDEWSEVSDLSSLTTRQYENLRKMLNREFADIDVDALMYRCI